MTKKALTTGDEGGSGLFAGFEQKQEFVDKASWIGKDKKGGGTDGGTDGGKDGGKDGGTDGGTDEEEDELAPLPPAKPATDPNAPVCTTGNGKEHVCPQEVLNQKYCTGTMADDRGLTKHCKTKYVDPDADDGTGASGLSDLFDTGKLLGDRTGDAMAAADKMTGGLFSSTTKGLFGDAGLGGGSGGGAKDALLDQVMDALGLTRSTHDSNSTGLLKTTTDGSDSGGSSSMVKSSVDGGNAGHSATTAESWMSDMFEKLGLDSSVLDFGKLQAITSEADMLDFMRIALDSAVMDSKSLSGNIKMDCIVFAA